MVDITRYEKETIIDYNEEEPRAHIYTLNRPLAQAVEKLADEFPDKVEILRPWREDIHEALDAEVPKDWIKLRPPAHRNMTPEQKKAAADRMRKAREAKAARLLAESVDKYRMGEDA